MSAPQLATVEALTAPLDRTEIHPVYGYLGSLTWAFEDQRHAAVLRDKLFSLSGETAYRNAVRAGLVALEIRAENLIATVVRDGNLLLCWPDTAAVKGAS